jgi:hypothetical protein
MKRFVVALFHKEKIVTLWVSHSHRCSFIKIKISRDCLVPGLNPSSAILKEHSVREHTCSNPKCNELSSERYRERERERERDLHDASAMSVPLCLKQRLVSWINSNLTFWGNLLSVRCWSNMRLNPTSRESRYKLRVFLKLAIIQKIGSLPVIGAFFSQYADLQITAA